VAGYDYFIRRYNDRLDYAQCPDGLFELLPGFAGDVVEELVIPRVFY